MQNPRPTKEEVRDVMAEVGALDLPTAPTGR